MATLSLISGYLISGYTLLIIIYPEYPATLYQDSTVLEIQLRNTFLGGDDDVVGLGGLEDDVAVVAGRRGGDGVDIASAVVG